MSNVICFGEILWDLLPTGKQAGGAPMNVAFHLNRLGVEAGMVSRIGDDALGREIFDFLKQKGIPTGLVQRDAHHPTGVVQVTLDAKGHPAYEIVQDVAWDYIAAEKAVQEAVRRADVLVFGSLAARSAAGKATLLRLIDQARFRVFDVNLRKPFFSKGLLDELLPKAELVKMNDDELDIVSDWHRLEGDQASRMAQVKQKFGLHALVLTRGEHGAIVLDDRGYHSHPGYRVEVQDTIGSGDAFLAGYLSKYTAGEAPDVCLDFACKMGAFVATQRGGTPEVNLEKIL